MANKNKAAELQKAVWDYYAQHGRDMPWRGTADPYCIMVSEIMLQQTQVNRVISKYGEFIAAFPTVAALASAPLAQVLTAWSGLGYNRRAKHLHSAAQMIVAKHGGLVPENLEDLTALPGIGKNTAGAILAYAFNMPAVFVETNIRTVYLHHFFSDKTQVNDKDIIEAVRMTIDARSPREWYWALMDYGAHLKGTLGSRLNQSMHYKKQSRFSGSMREMRGRILKALILVGGDSLAEAQLLQLVRADDRYALAMEALTSEGLVSRQGTEVYLTGHAEARIIGGNS